MRPLFRIIFTLCCTIAASWAADIPLERLQTTTPRETGQPTYYWKVTPVGNIAQLLTLFCRSCEPSQVAASATSHSVGPATPSGSSALTPEQDQPLIAVLRDTLGDNNPENDRLTSVWLLTYSHVNVGQRALSAVPFFYWRVGAGSKSVSAHDTAPFFDLTAPQHPVASEVGRDVLQWTMLDPMTTPIRASSRAYRTNQLDYERLHLEEAISYLRQAPASQDDSALTEQQLDTVIARLELRKRLLGGLVSETRAAQIGAESGFNEERIRSRNWELLRQCAERTGLFFEPLDLAGTNDEYAILWFPLHQSLPAAGTALDPVWKLLSIRNPWSDDRLKSWKGPVYTRALDQNGALVAADTSGARQVQLVPLAVYSLSYPKLPLLLVDFRDKLHVRWHEMTQRSINEVTAGVIGISHFTNWYFYVAADLYDFVVDRHGAAMKQVARLDCYSQFRVAVALDQQTDPVLRKEMQQRINSLALNPLEAAPARELESARERYVRLEDEATAPDGALLKRLDKQRRAELAYFEESKKARIFEDFLHDTSLGVYTHRAKPDTGNLTVLDTYRRVAYHLQLLDSLAEAGTPPEVAYETTRIQASVTELSRLMPSVSSPQIRAHVAATLERLRSLSRDENLQAGCSLALVALQRNPAPVRATALSGITASPRSIPLDSVNAVK